MVWKTIITDSSQLKPHKCAPPNRIDPTILAGSTWQCDTCGNYFEIKKFTDFDGYWYTPKWRRIERGNAGGC